MKFNELCEIIEQNNIPKDVELLSDSGWECDATSMNGVYYNKEENVIVFTQCCGEYEDYDKRCHHNSKYIALVPDDFE